ncbi:Holliday junction resolvase RuvX [Pacificimonas pallii]|uniref:Holliday junction resolvase RuvX n=1 Tax=Pacificimonas pallii TaxID=2827236 RepID=UPI0034E20693
MDPGTKTIGLAFCDQDWRIAGPDMVVRRTKQVADLAAVRARLNARGAKALIVGLPLNMDGTPGPSAQRSRALARTMEGAFDLPVLLWDETLTSVAAEDAMRAAGVPRAKWPEKIDAHAAAIMLQGALNWFARDA